MFEKVEEDEEDDGGSSDDDEEEVFVALLPTLALLCRSTQKRVCPPVKFPWTKSVPFTLETKVNPSKIQHHARRGRNRRCRSTIAKFEVVQHNFFSKQ